MLLYRWSAPAAALASALLAATPLAARADAAEDMKYCESQQEPARSVCIRDVKKAADPSGAGEKKLPQPNNPDGKPYKVVGGTRVDAFTMEGFRAWRNGACDRCHGANQEGMVGPSLIASLKTLSKADFAAVINNGRLDKGMPSFGQNPAVAQHIDALYAYLKGRSDGAITKAKVEPLD
ncbi:MAG TPA: c-type cytochrome [Methylibium sp.]|uniref:c-type cytochrome n=1 Tax=Methylibium sp. TaxID=2067992 RepID=UPI002DB5EF62|nr:c-type cytochrome [Methylibium sp.]HEU4459435.1 c-type cytochrome [Methylibium sp.]